MKIILTFLVLVCVSGCSTINKKNIFHGAVVEINTAPLSVDGEAEVDVKLENSEVLTFYVTSCNPPAPCEPKTIERLTNGEIKIGDYVEVKAYLWSTNNYKKYIIEKPYGYIKKLP